jgi:hypothetical protein
MMKKLFNEVKEWAKIFGLFAGILAMLAIAIMAFLAELGVRWIF